MRGSSGGASPPQESGRSACPTFYLCAGGPKGRDERKGGSGKGEGALSEKKKVIRPTPTCSVSPTPTLTLVDCVLLSFFVVVLRVTLQAPAFP